MASKSQSSPGRPGIAAKCAAAQRGIGPMRDPRRALSRSCAERTNNARLRRCTPPLWPCCARGVGQQQVIKKRDPGKALLNLAYCRSGGREGRRRGDEAAQEARAQQEGSAREPQTQEDQDRKFSRAKVRFASSSASFEFEQPRPPETIGAKTAACAAATVLRLP